MPTIASRHADKFVIRMPDGMRQRLVDFAAKREISMNTAAIDAVGSYLDHHIDLRNQLDGLRLLRASLEEQANGLDAERAEVAELKKKLLAGEHRSD